MANIQLGNLQLAIMRVLWADGECTVTSVHQALHPRHGLAPTTIATMLKKMEAKGIYHDGIGTKSRSAAASTGTPGASGKPVSQS